MKKTCPYCGGELEEGLVRSSRLIYWTKERRPLYTVDRQAGEFPLPGASGWMGSECPARCCPACGLILISTKEEDTI